MAYANRFELKGKSYATREIAIRKAEAAAQACGLANMRYLIGSSDDGRFVPVCFGGHEGMIVALIQRGMTVVG